MTPDEVQGLVAAGLPDCRVEVSGDGSHFDILVVGEQFADLSKVKRQQAVYATITEQITSGAVHAVYIKVHTPEEWQRAAKLQVSAS